MSCTALLQASRGTYIAVFGAFGAATAVCAFCRNLHYFVVAATASKRIHAELFTSTSHATLAFLETTRSGSLITRYQHSILSTSGSWFRFRFSSDMDSIDLQIPPQFSAFLFNLFEAASSNIRSCLKGAMLGWSVKC